MVKNGHFWSFLAIFGHFDQIPARHPDLASSLSPAMFGRTYMIFFFSLIGFFGLARTEE